MNTTEFDHPKEKPCCREYLYTNNENLVSLLKYHARHSSLLEESKFLSALIIDFLWIEFCYELEDIREKKELTFRPILFMGEREPQ